MPYVNNLRTFVRVYDLGSMSAAARDQRVSAAVASARIAELEKHLGVRLFNRTTRTLRPTEHGRIFYEGAVKILDAIAEAEAAVADVTLRPRGSIHVAAPLGMGKRLIAPLIPAFNDLYPEIDVRLRLSDRRLDITSEGLDLAFILGALEDFEPCACATSPTAAACSAPPPPTSSAAACRRAAAISSTSATNACCCVTPAPASSSGPSSTPDGPRRFEVSGALETDDGDVLTGWALVGRGIILKPVFEIADHLATGALVPVAEATPPLDVPLACLYPHKRLQDPKSRLFIDFAVDACRKALAEALARLPDPAPG